MAEHSLGVDVDRALSSPPDSVPGMALLVFSRRRILAEIYRGYGKFSADGSSRPVTSRTMWRIASTSKPSVALATLMLVERGLLDWDKDISVYLGKPFRNPHFPDAPITIRMLLGHTSSLRDADFYYPSLGTGLDELFEPGGRHYAGGAHFAPQARASDPGRFAPGLRYAYCNLGYGLLGGILERVTGLRFDRLMRRTLLDPLEIAGGFNVAELPPDRFEDLAPLYRKAPPESETINPALPWIAQVDDYPVGRPAVSVRLPPSGAGQAPSLDKYELGTNGSLFSPQGGLRISARDLAKLGILLASKGRSGRKFDSDGNLIDEVGLVSPAAVDSLFAPGWNRSSDGSNAEEESRRVYATGLGLMRCDGPRGKPGLWGHHGDAYGFLGGLYLDPGTESGYLYLLGGTGQDPETCRGKSGRWPAWEENLQLAAETYLAERVPGFIPS